VNIFVLSKHPGLAAEMACDKHVVKMPLESAQLLCGVFPEGIAPYRRSHYDHPCAKWTRASLANYNWLLLHGKALAYEYTHRYGRRHKSEGVIDWCAQNKHLLEFKQNKPTLFAQAMPQYCKEHDAVQAYRTYYICEKNHIAQWTRRAKPQWFKI